MVLPPNTLHIWQMDLDDAIDLPAILNPTEQERAIRFRFATDRQRWSVARKILRFLLAHYTGESPAAIRFVYGPYGKPSLQADASDAPHSLRFNMSHSGSRACIVFAREREVGIDIEQIRTNFSPVELAETCFSPAERDALYVLPANEQFTLFFQIWTGKEAYIKARGQGLSFPLQALTILPPPAPGGLMQITDDAAQNRNLSPVRLVAFPAPAGYIATVAVEGSADVNVIHFTWVGDFPTIR